MAITDYKMTTSDIGDNKIRDKVPDRLEGNPEENKKIFDRLPLKLIEKYNPAIDEIDSTLSEHNSRLIAINENLQEQIDGIERPANPLSPKGMYATIEELEAAHPVGAEGDAWIVGNYTSNVVYMWDTEQEDWVNIGVVGGGDGFRTAYNRSFETDPSNFKTDGIADCGVLNTVPRADHVHPSDTSKANLSGGYVVDEELLDEDTIDAWNVILGIS